MASAVSIAITVLRRAPRLIAGARRAARHLADVLDVLLPQLDRLRVVPEVVVAIGQPEAALVGDRHLHRRVLEVGFGAEAEEGVDADRVQLGDSGAQIA